MARVSSMTRMRGLDCVTFIGLSGGTDREFQDKGGAGSRAGALRIEAATELLGGQRAAVQAEAVPCFARGEAQGKNPGKVLGGYSDAIIRDGNAQPLIATRQRDRQFLVGAA